MRRQAAVGQALSVGGPRGSQVIGGPIAALLIRRGGLKAEGRRDLDIGVPNEGRAVRMDYFCILWAILALNVTVLLGLALHEAIAAAGVTLPAFVSCLVAGIILRNLLPLAPRRLVLRVWPGVDDALALISDLSLGLFLIMALMGLQIWELSGVLLFITVALVVQILLTVGFTIWVVFPAMGRDYEAAVISAGFGGITLGSTATAIAESALSTLCSPGRFNTTSRSGSVTPLRRRTLKCICPSTGRTSIARTWASSEKP